MRISKLVISVLLPLFFSIYLSCKKTDIKVAQTRDLETRFLTVPANVPSAVKRIAETIRKQNEKFRFLNEFIKKQGFARWDKSPVISKPVGYSARNQTSEGDTIVIVPLVKIDSSRVTAFFACRVTDDSVNIKLYRADRFAIYPISNNTDSLTSTFIAHQIMVLDYLTFGYEKFLIKDSRIFNYPNVPSASDGSRYLHLKPHMPSGRLSRNAEFINFEVCWEEYIPPYGYQTGGTPPGASNDYGHYETRCRNYTIYVQTFYPDASGGGGAVDITYTGGGGGGSSDNWSGTPNYYNSDPCQDPNGNQVPTDYSCQDGVIGWQPMYPFFNATIEANNFTNPCIVAAKNKIGDLDLIYLGKTLLWQKDQNTQDWKIIFDEDRTLKYPDGRPQPSESFPRSSLKEWHISLNPVLWEQTTAANATQELAGLAIIHEFTHGFLWVNREFYNLDYSNLLFSSHEQMFLNCVNGMTTLIEKCFNLSHADATALALQGMDDVLQKTFSGNTLTSYNAEKNQFAIAHYGMSIPDAEAIFDQYSNGTKGTRCF